MQSGTFFATNPGTNIAYYMKFPDNWQSVSYSWDHVQLPFDWHKISSQTHISCRWRGRSSVREGYSPYHKRRCSEWLCHQRRYLVLLRNMCIFHRYPFRYGLSVPDLVVACTHFPLGTGFTLTSSKGKCTVSNNVLTCASSVSTAAIFTVNHQTLIFSLLLSLLTRNWLIILT